MEFKFCCWIILSSALFASARATFGFPQYISNTKGELSTNGSVQWIFTTEVQFNQKIYVKVKSGYDNKSFIVSGKHPLTKSSTNDLNCFYFTRQNDTSSKCNETLNKDSCDHRFFFAKTLALTYSHDQQDDVVAMEYEYSPCSEPPTTSVTSPPTSSPIIPSLSEIPTPQTTTPQTTSTGLSTDNGISTTGSPPTTKAGISGRAGTSLTKDSSKSTETSFVTPEAKESGTDTIIIIVVVIVVIFFIGVGILLFFCGKRFKRLQKQMKELHSSSAAPPGDPLYEEIVPQLPNRNANMREPGYEVPLCVTNAPENRRNDGYMDAESGFHHTSSSDVTTQKTKYGVVENELYETDEINGNIIRTDSDKKVVANTLYHDHQLPAANDSIRTLVVIANKNTSIENQTNATEYNNPSPMTEHTDLIGEEPEPELAITTDGSHAVNNVLYNM